MITETEQAYIARIREYFGNELVSVDTHPGDWSDSVLRTMLINAPAIYVAWLGAGEGRTRGRWSVTGCSTSLATCSTGVRPAAPDCIRLWPG